MILIVIIVAYFVFVIYNIICIILVNMQNDCCSKDDIVEQEIPITKAFNPFYFL